MAFVKRQIHLTDDQNAVVTLLKATDLDVCLGAEGIISKAEERAQYILREAEEQAEQIRLQAEQEASEQAVLVRQRTEQAVWQDVNSLITALKNEKEALWRDIEQSATTVLNEALALFMGQVDHTEKAQILVQQLVKVQRQPQKGLLFCPLTMVESVRTTLEQQLISHWDVQVDNSLAENELSLVTNMGSFRCSWEAICEQLIDSSDARFGEEQTEDRTTMMDEMRAAEEPFAMDDAFDLEEHFDSEEHFD